MWLIDTHTLHLKRFADEVTVEYAILSHTWHDQDEEVTFQDIQSLPIAKTRTGFHKIDRTCHQARADGIRYAWIDSCCIDKTASAELSEAINSMFKWYQRSKTCYAYLSDYTYGRDDLDSSVAQRGFGRCQWFTRGWTLQELIASDNISFFNSRWDFVGDKASLINLLARTTGIETIILDSSGSAKNFALQTMSVATRMSWASKRRTTRKEDEAYALMGIFSVNMPLLYGEGKGASRRLQEHILARSTDHSILLWRSGPPEITEVFAPSPAAFRGNDQVIQHHWSGAAQTEFVQTNVGIRMLLPVMEMEDQGFCAVLCCRYADDLRGPILLPLVQYPSSDSAVLYVHRPAVIGEMEERFPVLPVRDDASLLAKITKKPLLLLESYTAYPMTPVRRANVVFKPSHEFSRVFTIAEVFPEGRFNHNTQTLSWLVSQLGSSSVVSGSITWLEAGGMGIKLVLTLDHRLPYHRYHIEVMEVERGNPSPQQQDTTQNSVHIIRHLAPVRKQTSYDLRTGTVSIRARETTFLNQRIVSISLSLNTPSITESVNRTDLDQSSVQSVSSNGTNSSRPRL